MSFALDNVDDQAFARIRAEADARNITPDEVVVRLVSLWAAVLGSARQSEACRDVLRLCRLD